MSPVFRAVAVYLFMMIVVRATGRRLLSEMTAFDFVLVIIISEATQNAMIGDDASMTAAALVILTLVVLDVGFSYVKRFWAPLARCIEGVPTIVVEDGRPLHDRLQWARIDLEDVLESARQTQGIERLSQIKYAVLERGGSISIIPHTRKT